MISPLGINKLFGECVISVDNQTLMSKSKEGSANFTIMYPHLDNKEYILPHDVSGVLLAVVLLRHDIVNFQTIPQALILFKCTPTDRDTIILDGEFNSNDKRVYIQWLSTSQTFAFYNYSNFENVEAIDFAAWWNVVQRFLNVSKGETIGPCIQKSKIWFSTGSAKYIFSKWNVDLEEKIYECDTVYRYLSKFECKWLLVHIWLKWNKSKTVAPAILRSLVRQIIISSQHDHLLEKFIPDHDQNIDSHAYMAIFTTLCRPIVNEILSAAKQKLMEHERAVVLYDKHIATPMNQIRKRYCHYGLFISLQLSTFTQDCIKTIPIHLTDSPAIEKWVLKRSAILKESFSDDVIISETYANAKPVYSECSEEFLRLYGNLPDYIHFLNNIFSQEEDIFPTPLYFPEQLGCLSTSSDSPLIPLCSPKDMPHDTILFRTTHCLTETRLTEASEYCLPIWTTPNSSGSMTFFRISLRWGQHNKRSRDMSSADMEEIFSKNLDLLEMQEGEMINEYLQSGMHWSSFVADIDINEGSFKMPIVCDTVRDCVSLVNDVFQNVLGFLPAKLFIFSSTQNHLYKKQGLHCHAKLPLGLVMTSNACYDLARAMEQARFKYPETLGLPCANEKVFDTKIYPRELKEDKPKGHCLRSPFQVKRDGTCKLQCMYQTHKLTNNDLFVHAPHFDITGNRIIFGKVITHIEGIRDRRDEHFYKTYLANVVDSNISDVAKVNIDDIIKALNQKSILFNPNSNHEEHINILLWVLNDLWSSSGVHNAVSYMQEKKGANGCGFQQPLIRLVATKSGFVYDCEKRTINLVIYGPLSKINPVFPFCLIRPHRRKNTSNMKVHIGYSDNMYRFILLVHKCYKASCEGKSFVPGITLPLLPVYIAPCIKQWIQSFLRSKFVGYDVILTRHFYASKIKNDETDTGDSCIIEEHVVHGGDGIGHLLPAITGNIKRLYAVLPDNFLMLKSYTNYYIMCVMDEEKHVFATKSLEILWVLLDKVKVIKHVLKGIHDVLTEKH